MDFTRSTYYTELQYKREEKITVSYLQQVKQTNTQADLHWSSFNLCNIAKHIHYCHGNGYGEGCSSCDNTKHSTHSFMAQVKTENEIKVVIY